VAVAPVEPTALPPLTVDQLGDGGSGSRRIQHFDAYGQDVRMVVRALADNFGLGYEIDPDVRGTVNTRLENATLEQALGSVLGPLGYAFQVQGGIIRVSGTRVQTRIFSLDYVSLSRIGTTSTVSTRRLGGSQGGFGGGSQLQGGVGGGGGFGGTGGGGGASETIQSVTAADLWAGIRVALEAIVFDTPAAAVPRAPGDTTAPVATTAVAAPPQPTVPLGGQSGLSYTSAHARSASDGRQLVIDPFAGTIMVTAPQATLAQVDGYINTIQAAVQRQVLIEAKIVEVELRREFRFGIDWRTLAQTARLGIEFLGGAAEATNTLTLRLGGGSSQVQVALRALETQGDVSVLASPMISALHNQPAQFEATDDEVFFSIVRQPIIGAQGIVSFSTEVVPQQISVGIVLNVLAQIGADNTITMLVRPGLSEVFAIREQLLGYRASHQKAGHRHDGAYPQRRDDDHRRTQPHPSGEEPEWRSRSAERAGHRRRLFEPG